MIGRLTGTLLEKKPPQLLLDVNGVGYEVDASMNTFYNLPDDGQTITLFTHFVVREDCQLLYGFIKQNERSLFRSLIKVNGVGPKMALTILSSITPDHFVECVQHNDTASLVRLPGVGKKTAERLIIEMRDRLSDYFAEGPDGGQLQPDSTIFVRRTVVDDAVSALVALGYKLPQATKVIHLIDDNTRSREELIRDALRELAG